MYRLTLSEQMGLLAKDVRALVELTGVKFPKVYTNDTSLNLVSHATNEHKMAKRSVVSVD